MKEWRTIAILLAISVFSFAGSYFCLRQSEFYERHRWQVIGFWISDTPPEYNYWDALNIGLFVLGASCILATVLLRRSRNR
jgi:hypothetical protein